MRESYYAQHPNRVAFEVFTSVKQKKTDRFRIHRHANLELGYIVRGRGKYIIENSEYDISDGDLYMVRPGEQHCIPTITSDFVSSFNFHITPFFLSEISINFIPKKKLLSLIDPKAAIPHRIVSEEVRSIIEEIRGLVPGREENRHRIFFLTLSLIEHICGFLPPAEEKIVMLADRHLSDIQSAMDFMESHICEKISMDDICRFAKMSRTALTSAFQSVYGMSAYDYLLFRRCESAAELLATTDDSVTDIAYSCGYNNIANFNRQFKKIMSVTPLKYRMRKKDSRSIM